MLWELYIVQNKRHALDTSAERLNPVSIFDKEKSVPAEVED